MRIFSAQARNLGPKAVSVFVWPLYGVHKRIEAAKEQALDTIDRRLEKTFAEFKRHFDAEDGPALQALSGKITGPEVQHRRIRETPTWPWKPETAQFALTAIALPLIFAVLPFLVEQVIN